MENVFIKKVASFFPNEPVGNDEMEDFLGLVGGKHSRVKNIILRQNGIKTRYYALDKRHNTTHTNAQMAALAIDQLFDDVAEKEKIQVLTCGSSIPDQLLPSQASMVHGAAFKHPMEIFSLSGVCLSSLMALKTAFMSILSNNSHNAVCSASELISPIMLAKFFDEEIKDMAQVENNPILAFEKDFLRYMLSDGAAALYLTDTYEPGSLKIEWIETVSYANLQPACMYMWADYDDTGNFKSWKKFSADEISKKSIWSLKQDVKLLNKVVIKYFVDAIELALSRHDVQMDSIRYVIPHISSMYFYNKLSGEINRRGIDLPVEKWFTNLTTVGNCGSVAIFAALDELLRTHPMEKEDKILLLIPESGRFSYGIVLLTVK